MNSNSNEQTGGFGPHLRTPDLEAYTNIPRQTWAKYRCIGCGPKFIKVGSTVIYDKRDVDAWLAQRKAASCAELFEQRERAQRNGATEAPDTAPVKRRGRPPKARAAAEATATA